MRIITKIAGIMHHDGAMERLRTMQTPRDQTPLTLVREPTNLADPNAVRIEHQGLLLGYVPRNQARLVGQAIVTGRIVRCRKIVPFFNGILIEWEDDDEGDPILR